MSQPATAPQADLPPAAFPPLPGWLAFTVQPRTAREAAWTPDHPNAKIAMFNPSGWDELAEGTAFRAVTSQGDLEVKYSELSEIPFGCDDIPTQMVAFQGPYDFAEEPVWILPADMTGGKAFAPVAGESSAKARSWTVGQYQVSLEKTGDAKGELHIERADSAPLIVPFEKLMMDGGDEGPLDLSNDDELGVPIPVAAFSIKANMPGVLVTRTTSFEGVTFNVYTMNGDQPVSVGDQGVYLCAF